MRKSVSILVPVFNRRNYIAECIESALRQKYDKFEIVIVDNFSNDGTWEICQEYAHHDKRIRAIRNESNIGPVRNWLRCARESSGEYSKILFSDDLIDEYCLPKMIDNISEQVAFVYSSARLGGSMQATKMLFNLGKNLTMQTDEYLDLVVNWRAPVSPGAILLRRKDLIDSLESQIISKKKCDFLSHGAGPDVLIMLNTIKKYDFVKYIDEPLSYFRSHADSLTIANKNNTVFEGYTAAVLGYLESNNNNRMLTTFLARQWLKETLTNEHFTSISKFKRMYLENPMEIDSLDVLKLIPKILAKEGIRRLIKKLYF